MNKNRRTKILEVLISTLVFVIVLFSGVISLVAMNNSNKNLEFLSKANSCSDEIKGKINEYYQVIAFSNSTLFALEESNGDYLLKDVTKIPGKRGDFSGFLVVTRQDNSTVEANLIIKKPTQEKFSYLFGSVIVEENNNIKDETTLSHLIKTEDLEEVDSCVAYGEKSSKNLKNPYSISYITTSNQGDVVELEVSDFIYPKNSLSVFSRLFIRESRVL